jgi:AMP deaminase
MVRRMCSDLYLNAYILGLAETAITAELAILFQSLQKCLDLRDKYMVKSRQRLGDNPRDHDGYFPGLDDGIADVSGVRPDSDFKSNHPPPSPFEPWRVYPRPPPPHWHWTDKENVVSADGKSARTDSEFVFEDCAIPEPHAWDFDIDDKGVFQVYENSQGDTSLLGKCHIYLNVSDSRKQEAIVRCAKHKRVLCGS